MLDGLGSVNASYDQNKLFYEEIGKVADMVKDRASRKLDSSNKYYSHHVTSLDDFKAHIGRMRDKHRQRGNQGLDTASIREYRQTLARWRKSVIGD
jgi:hypothetical protein